MLPRCAFQVSVFCANRVVAPLPSQAARTRKEAIFGNGEAKLWKTSTDDLNVMGAGVTLYYRMLKYLSLAFALMSLVVVPSVFLCITGHKAERSDSINWVSTSIGNSGPVSRHVVLLLLCCVRACVCV